MESAAASFAWSKAGARVPLAVSTRMNSLPSAVVTRYQKRSSGSQLARTPVRKIRELMLSAERLFGALVIGGGIDAGLRGKRRGETGEGQYK